jgi:predicted TIM-barrel fold metal-dependent hydrolase
MLLYSSDYPHWHFDGDEVLPDGLSDAVVDRMLKGNPTDTYARMGGAA